MVIAAVDPNKQDLKQLIKYLRTAFLGCDVVMFTDPMAAVAYIRDNPIDVIFTEVAMLGVTGLSLQKAVEAVQPAILTVFTTATDVYAGEALKARAQGYILKPVTREALRESLSETKFISRKRA